MTTDFAAAAARIEANPLGRIMYGQRELFHSNLLAWFFDVLPGPADAVFASLARPRLVRRPGRRWSRLVPNAWRGRSTNSSLT